MSMLGAEVDWVRNVKAAGGHVTLRHGRRELVCLEEVPADRRASILKAYLKRAPGPNSRRSPHGIPCSAWFPMLQPLTDS